MWKKEGDEGDTGALADRSVTRDPRNQEKMMNRGLEGGEDKVDLMEEKRRARRRVSY
jgi:hypothetical protein